MKDSDWEDWRTELMRKIEALHIRVLDAEAFHSAAIEIFEHSGWTVGNDQDSRRDRNRLATFLEQLGIAIDQVLAKSREALDFAMRRTGRVSE